MKTITFPRVLIMSAALLTLAACGSNATSSSAPAPTRATSAPAKSTPGHPPAGSATTGKQPTKPAAPVTSPGYGDGTFIVGKDIKPGTYTTIVPSNSKSCFWERDRSLDPNSTDSIIDSDSLYTGAHGLVVIAPTDKAFGSASCGTWKLASNPATPATRIGEGTFRVGIDVKPGRYTTTVPKDSLGCFWERTRSYNGGDPNSTIASADGVGGGTKVTVTLAPTDKLFKTSSCGTFVLG